MLGYFIIGIALLVALMLGANAIANANPKKMLRTIRITLAIVLGGLAAFFTYTGRFHFAPPLAAAAIFLLRRRPLFGSSQPSSGQQSDVRTDWLHATLDHDSGSMNAEILKGEFAGRQLSDLSFSHLNKLYEELQEDEQSAVILNTFIERNFSDHQENNDSNSRNNEKQWSNSGTQNGMSKTEAYEILDLQPGASVKEIKNAHKKLIKQFHPDHNGSAYMAAKINQAKDLLLK